MTERRALRAQPRIGQIQGIQASGEQLQLFRQAATTLNNFAITVDQKLDKQAAIDGTRQGIQDGQDGRFDPQLLYSPTIKGEQYTQSALQTYTRTVDLESRNALHKIAARNARNPGNIKQEAEAYISGQVELMPPEVDSNVRRDFELRQRLAVNTLVQQANGQAVQLERSRLKAGVIKQNRDITVEIDRVAGSILADDPEERIAALQEIFTLREYIAAGYESTFEDEFGNVQPVFLPEQAAIATEAFNKQFRESAVKGWFLGKKSKIDALNTFMKGELKQEVGDPDTGEIINFEPFAAPDPENPLVMTAPEIQTMSTWMRAQVSNDISLRASITAQADKLREKQEDQLEIQFYNATDPVERQTLAQTIMLLSHDSKRVNRIRKEMNELGPQGFTQPGVINQLYTDIADGEVVDPSDLDKYSLGTDKRMEFNKLLLGRRNASDTTSTRAFKVAVDQIYLELEGETLEGFGRRATKKRDSEAARIHGEFLRLAGEAQEAGMATTFNPRAVVEELLGSRTALKAELAKVQDQLSEVREQIIEKSAVIKSTPDPETGFAGFFRGYLDPENDGEIKALKKQQKILEEQEEDLRRRTER